jgi:peptide/nickel transport system substrate-binding protein
MMANARSKFAVGLGLISVIALAVAVGSSAAGRAGTTTIRIATSAKGPFVQTFNPLVAGGGKTNGSSVAMIYEPLYKPTTYKNGSTPWLATSADWSNGGKTLTIHVRRGVKWSDGQAMTAKDVAYTFNLLIKNAAMNLDGLPLVSASAPSADKAVVRFSTPGYHYRWWGLTPVPEHLWKSVGDPVTFTNPNPVGTGPFTFKSFSTQAITLARNPLFWGPKPKLDTVQYLAFDTETSMLAALQAGELDWITTGVANPAGIAKQSGKIAYWLYERPDLIYLFPNNATAPTNDKALRLAISRAIDRRTIAVQSFFDRNPPEFSPTGLNSKLRGQFVAKKFKKLSNTYSPSAAKQILTAAGYKLGANGVFSTPSGTPLNLTLLVPNSSPAGDWIQAGKLIAQNLTDVGIPTTVKSESTNAQGQDFKQGKYQLTLKKDGGDAIVYNVFANILAQGANLVSIGSDANQNAERYASSAADRYLAAFGASLPGSKAQAAALEHLESLMVNDAPVIPLWRVSGGGMWRTDRFTGWPSAKNPYASPESGDDTAELVLLKLTPIG